MCLLACSDLPQEVLLARSVRAPDWMTRAAVDHAETALLEAGLTVRRCEQLQVREVPLACRCDFGDGVQWMLGLMGEVGRALAPDWIRLAHLPQQVLVLGGPVSRKLVGAVLRT